MSPQPDSRPVSDVEPTPLEGHELFVAVLAQIEREPHRWNQATYSPDCGTAMCFAGWACRLSGATPSVEFRVATVASTLLGIDEWQQGRGHLFSSGNDLNTLYAISAELMGIDEQVLRDKVRSVVAGSDLTA